MRKISKKVVYQGRSAYIRLAILTWVGLGTFVLFPTLPSETTLAIGDARGQTAPEHPAPPVQRPKFIAHEWGTFTTLVGADGKPQYWRGEKVSPLPKFVHQSWLVPEGKGGSRGVHGTVRMETPVVYFYTPTPLTVSLEVEFPTGYITEWYPQGQEQKNRHYAGNSIKWSTVKLTPFDALKLPTDSTSSHYYAARATDSVPIIIDGEKGPEIEKFLFYRGVGSFDLPLTVSASGNHVEIQNKHADGIAGVFLFERRGDKVGFRQLGRVDNTATLTRPTLQDDIAALHKAMEQVLRAQGLYVKEAQAMVATWRDVWFEEGLRILYLVPRNFTDQVLPLSIVPAPSELVRVLVGRIDIVNSEGQTIP